MTPFFLLQMSYPGSVKIRVLSYSSTAPTLSVSGGTITSTTPAIENIAGDGIGATVLIGGLPTDSYNVTTQPFCLYGWTFEVTGLAAGVNYAATVTQGAASRNIEKLNARPSGDPRFAAVSCYGNNTNTTDRGAFGRIRQLRESGQIDALLWPDDVGYVDRLRAPSSDALNSRFCNDPNGAAAQGTAYSYCVGYSCLMGLANSIYFDLAATQPSPSRYSDVDWQWCAANIPIICVPGDHNQVNGGFETGELVSTTQSDNSFNAWKATFGSLQDTINSTNSAAISTVWGSVQIIGIDRCFGLPNNLSIYSSATQTPSGQSILGAAQIADVQGAINSTSDIKLVLMPLGSRWTAKAGQIAAANTAGYTLVATGEQEPLHDFTVNGSGDSDWTKLFTAAGGIAGKFTGQYRPLVMAIHGDTHHPAVHYINTPRHFTSAQQQAITYWQFSVGSVNGQATQGKLPLITNIGAIDTKGTLLEWLPAGINNSLGYIENDTNKRWNGYALITISGISKAKSAVVSMYDVDPNTNSETLMYTRQLSQISSNPPQLYQ